jgi:acyl carrier protein
MNKESFCAIISSIKKQMEREDKFCDAIKQAFADAGQCEDFVDSQSFKPPTDVFIDNLIEALALEFVSEHQTHDEAQDLINWFIYEMHFGEELEFISNEDHGSFQILDPEPRSASWYEVDGTRVWVRNEQELYDALVREATNQCNSAMNDPKFMDVYNRIVPIIDNRLHITANNGTDKILPASDIYNDFGEQSADSLDLVEIIMDIENEFGITLSDDEWMNIRIDFTPASITKIIINRMKS